MPRNVEIKARMKDVKKLKVAAKELSGSDGTLIVQEDTFFLAPNGRLKLRQIQGDKSELIFYKREANVCSFHTVDVPNPQQLKCILGESLGVRGTVKKQRTLYMVGQTRVHVDQVEGLGEFMELEVQLSDSDTAEEGKKIARDLMEKLDVSDTDLISVAYIDMILDKMNN